MWLFLLLFVAARGSSEREDGRAEGTSENGVGAVAALVSLLFDVCCWLLLVWLVLWVLLLAFDAVLWFKVVSID